jgi:hypothetical protein
MLRLLLLLLLLLEEHCCQLCNVVWLLQRPKV